MQKFVPSYFVRTGQARLWLKQAGYEEMDFEPSTDLTDAEITIENGISVQILSDPPSVCVVRETPQQTFIFSNPIYTIEDMLETVRQYMEENKQEGGEAHGEHPSSPEKSTG